jgi:hypothetical protein
MSKFLRMNSEFQRHDFPVGMYRWAILKLITSRPFNTFIILTVASQTFITGLECGYPYLPWYIGGTLSEAALCFEWGCRLLCFGTLYIREYHDLVDFIILAANFFDLVGRSCVDRGHSQMNLARTLVCLRGVRLVLAANYPANHGATLSVPQIAVSVMNRIPLTLVYTCAFYVLMATVGALLVTTDALPELSHLRCVFPAPCNQVIAFLGSLSRSGLTVFEILTLDNWFSNICQHLIYSDRWLSTWVVIIVVTVGSVGYPNILLGCVVDSVSFSSRNAQEVTDRIREMKSSVNRENVMTKLQEVLTNSTNNDSRGGDRETLSRAMRHDPTIITSIQASPISVADAFSLLSVLDCNNSGAIDISAIRGGIRRLGMDAQGQDVVRINVLTNKIEVLQGLVCSENHKTHGFAQACLERLGEIHSTIHQIRDRMRVRKTSQSVDRIKASKLNEIRRHLHSNFHEKSLL